MRSSIKIEFLAKEIVVTQTFLKKASRWDSFEYHVLNTALKENPGYKLTLKKNIRIYHHDLV
jgi:hypothetical protein